MAGVLGFAGTWRPRGVAANGAACGAARVRDATVFGIWRTAFGARHRRPTVRLLATTTISSEERYLPLCSAHTHLCLPRLFYTPTSGCLWEALGWLL